MAELEQRLSGFADVLPEAFTDPELAKIVYREAKSNEMDEPYALWRKIADKPTPAGVTLRSKVQNIMLKRSRGKTSAEAQSFTSVLDETDYLQVYIHGFEEWDSTEVIPATFTPLTINDIDVTELTLYDSLGNTTILKVDTIPPAYPIAVVGLNEGMAMENEFGSNNRTGSLGKTTGEPTIRITKIKLKKSAWRYEPWFHGKNAELYIRVYSNDTADDPDLWKFGLFAPEGSNKSYRVWKRKRWRGYRQDKPWQTINLNTGWPGKDSFLPDENYVFRLMEYDLFFYDGGIDDWCNKIKKIFDIVGAAVAIYFREDQPLLSLAIGKLTGYAAWWTCDYFILNDDMIDEKKSF